MCVSVGYCVCLVCVNRVETIFSDTVWKKYAAIKEYIFLKYFVEIIRKAALKGLLNHSFPFNAILMYIC